MGVCINYKGAIERKYAKSTLDHAESVAREMKEVGKSIDLDIAIRRPDDLTLLVDVAGCETTAFELLPFPKETGGFNYEWAVLEDYQSIERSHTGEHYEKWPDQKLLWFSGFTKTQFADTSVAHRFVAELVRAVCGRASFAAVDDEGDYYHSGEIEDAVAAIAENGAMIANIGGLLSGMGYDLIRGGETTIKKRKGGNKK